MAITNRQDLFAVPWPGARFLNNAPVLVVGGLGTGVEGRILSVDSTWLDSVPDRKQGFACQAG